MEQIREFIEARIMALYGIEVAVSLTRPDVQFGDYSTNIALQLSKQLGQNPRQIADEICTDLQHESIAHTQVEGPGFINITLSDSALVALTESTLATPNTGTSIVIETNNPNPFKAMHIGHAFNSVLGDTLANLLEQSGADVYRVSYHGDVGLHVGKSMYSLLKYVDGDVDKLRDIAPAERNTCMSHMYAAGSRAYKEDEQAKAEINELTKQSFARDNALYAAVYDTVFAWSFEQIDKNVARLGNKPTVQKFLESEAELRGVEIVRNNTPHIFHESDGALIFKGSEHGSFDNAFVSNRGTGLYAARDLGLIQLKNEHYHAAKSYIVTAEEQRAYFKGVIAAAELCFPELTGVTVNISTGTVKLATGKMSSREGDVVEIDWLFDQVAEAIKARGGEPNDELIAGVLRYEFLRVRIGSDVVFDVNEAVSLQGNSGPYLQYAHARAQSILHKFDFQAGSLRTYTFEPDERSLLRKIGEFHEVVELACKELLPHHIAHYLYELAQVFNRFYENNRVIGDSRQAVRADLVNLYAQTLSGGLELLGINAPESM